MKIRLFTTWYKSYRDEENEACLEANLMNPDIHKVYLLCDDGKKFPTHEKIVGIYIDHRPTYNDFFSAVNESEPEISIIANSDIYFDSSLEYVKHLKDKECFALSRWNDTLQGSSLYNRADSQDAWIFKGTILKVDADFELGRLGCDNRILEELHKSGYSISNPSKTIKAHHLHLEKRTENSNHDKSKTIPPPYRYIAPTEIVPFMSIVTRHYYKRPNMFKNCCESVLMQKDQDFEHVIIEDNVGVGSLRANTFFFENKDRVIGKYVFMLDDDDIFTSNEFVGDMKAIAEKYNPQIIFVRMLINDYLFPTDVNWKKSALQRNHIGTSNVVVRNDIWQKYIHNFSSIQVGDFEFINSVFKSLPSMECSYWQDKIYSKTVRVSRGKPE
jgi:hypothetical protein